MAQVNLAPTVRRLLEARRHCNNHDFERALAELATLLGAEPPPDTHGAELEAQAAETVMYICSHCGQNQDAGEQSPPVLDTGTTFRCAACDGDTVVALNAMEVLT
jgi:predicted SprT family Zn-dependent metalloprotease